MSPLRKRFLEDMQLHGYSPKTQSCYVGAVRALARFYHQSPDRVTEEELRQYFLHLTLEKKVARATATIALCGIKFFCRIAISNSRLEKFENGQVTFAYRDHKTQELKHLTLPAEEFIRRFLRHVLLWRSDKLTRVCSAKLSQWLKAGGAASSFQGVGFSE
jgi:hypothetical protein